MPIVNPDGEIAEAVRESIVGGKMFGILNDSINEVTEAANPRELRLPAIGDSPATCSF